MHSKRVAVIGAGWAGLACAVRLVQSGAQVEVFESARIAGGRARRAEVRGITLDNGQHILIGAYRQCLALMQDVGVAHDALERVPLALECPGRFSFKAARSKAPWHILIGVLTAQGLSITDRLALLRWMVSLQRSNYAADAAATVADWTAHLPIAVRRWLIDPLCISALNTPSSIASARVFATVLRDSLGGARELSDLLIPRIDLSALFPDTALSWLAARGAVVHLGHVVRRITPSARSAWTLDDLGTDFDAVVVSTPPWVASDLLHRIGEPSLEPVVEMIEALKWEPITTVYLHASTAVQFRSPMLALDPDPARRWLGQFAFDRTRCGGPAGWIAVVLSASHAATEMEAAHLAQLCADQLAAQIDASIKITDSRVIRERRATFSCTPGVRRPEPATPLPGLYLAGDYTSGDYPATLEHAVRSGERVAGLIASHGNR